MSSQNVDVAIIGGGIGGLAAGCYLQMNGYQTVVLEKCHQCGGVSVAWKRGDYLFDGATNWLPGSAATVPELHAVLAEVLDFSQLEIIDFDEFMQVEHEGEVFHVYTNADRWNERCCGSPLRTAPPIRAFADAIRQVSRIAVPVHLSPEVLTLPQLVAFLLNYRQTIGFALKRRGTTIAQYADRFRSEKLRCMFQRIFPSDQFFSLLGLLTALGWMHARGAGYPRGGSNRLTQLLEERYVGLGGDIRTGTAIEEILVHGGRASGVRCHDGTTITTRFVVSAVDRHHTLHHLLGGRYSDPASRDYFTGNPVYPALVQVSLGLARTFDHEPHKVVLPLATPVSFGKQRHDHLLLRICNFDDAFAPPGKTSLVAHYRTHDHEYWVSARQTDRPSYQSDKKRILAATLETLDRRFGPCSDHLEASDVATPATYIRYSNNWKGSYQAFAPIPRSIGRSLPKTIPGISQLYLAGQWISPGGGLPRVISIGRHVALNICRQDHRQFQIV